MNAHERLVRVRLGLQRLRQAARLIDRETAPKTAAVIRRAISSGKGAERHAKSRMLREGVRS